VEINWHCADRVRSAPHHDHPVGRRLSGRALLASRHSTKRRGVEKLERTLHYACQDIALYITIVPSTTRAVERCDQSKEAIARTTRSLERRNQSNCVAEFPCLFLKAHGPEVGFVPARRSPQGAGVVNVQFVFYSYSLIYENLCT
jgi:hypothetical protein